MKRDRQGRGRKVAGDREQAKQPVNGEMLRSAVTWIVEEKIFDNLQFHGNTKWLVCDLIILAVFWVWSDHRTLTGAFVEAHGWSMKMLGRAAVGTYQGLTGALASVTSTLLPRLWSRMQSLMERQSAEHWRIAGWLPLAVDGSRISVPRTATNEQAFCAPNFGHSATAKYRRKKRRQRGVPSRKKPSHSPKPQIWLTLVWHMGLRLPWCWRTGPSHSSERSHVQDLLSTQKFSAKTLFCGDAGFVGYDFWRDIADQGHHFVMRVGSNVTLLRKLGYARESQGTVYCWPSKVVREQPPLVLRLLSMQFGRTPVYLVTNILSKNELPDTAIRQLYQLRWGIELQFRTIKQTFGLNKLRSKSPERALRELDWSLLGLWMIQLFAVKEQLAIGQPPAKSSVALAIYAIRAVFHHWSEIPAKDSTLKMKLRHAITDNYQRSNISKRPRYRPENKDKPAAGKPTILNANREHKRRLKQYIALVT